MVTIKDGCGCDPCDCDWKQKLKEAYARASVSVNKIGDDAGSIYYPDGTGYVKLPLPTRAQVAQIQTNADDIATLKQRATTSEGNIDTLEQDVARIDAKDTAQDTNIKDNSDRITSTYNDLVSTEATVATHDSEIITLQAQTQALNKSLVSDVLMTDGTTAGSVQVSIEREDGALITSANYKWGRDIGVRLEAGTQAGYIKTVIDLSDGTTLTSNEYKIVEVLESDVYVTAITLVPDMTAGTIGGTISYSNGTTQTINAVNVPTAPGVTSAIEALQGRMTAVEQKNTQQDSSISALDSRVKAIEDTPGVGQFGAGKLGTIAGSTTDGRIKAEDDGTGSVNGWSDLKQRVSTAEGQIVTAQNDISDIKTKNTQQDSAISGLQTSKVNIAQGAANAGKALVVGSDGNVAPGEISSGEVWEEIDLANIPNDWRVGDRIKVKSKIYKPSVPSTATTWTSDISGITYSVNPYRAPVIEFELDSKSASGTTFVPIHLEYNNVMFNITYIRCTLEPSKYTTSSNMFYLGAVTFNGHGLTKISTAVTSSNITNYIVKMWRLKK